MSNNDKIISECENCGSEGICTRVDYDDGFHQYLCLECICERDEALGEADFPIEFECDFDLD